MYSKVLFNKFKILLFFAYLIPLVILLLFVAHFSVNVPYWDQWNLVNLFNNVATGEVTFGDFFAQNNEHRLVFPKLIVTPLAFISNWDIRYELYFSIFLAAITFFALYCISLNQKENKHNISWHLTNILAWILVFSLVQYENWLWGFQIAWFLINACLSIAVLIIALSKNAPRKLYFAAIPCFIASFSSAHGLLTWLALIPAVASLKGNPKQRVIRILIWILLFTGTCAVYFTGYQKPGHNVNTLFFLKEPLTTGSYFFTLLGTPLLHTAKYAPIVGLIICLFFCFLTAQFIKKYPPKFQANSQAALWISIGLFALLFALMTTFGRASLGGVQQAMVSRYTTPSVLLIISTAHLWRLFFLKFSVKRNIFFVTTITVILLFNYIVYVIPQAGVLKLYRQVSATCLELVNFIDQSPDSCLAELYPSTSQLREFAGILDRLGFRKFPKDKDIAFITAPVKLHGFFDYPPTAAIPCIFSKSKSLNVARWAVLPDGYIQPPPFGRTTCSLSKNGSINVAGWATLPDSQELPKIVLLSYGNNRSFFASAFVNLDSPDVAKALNSNRFNKVRWSVNISPKFLPLGEKTIKAWVYNPANKQFIQLNGEPKIKVVE